MNNLNNLKWHVAYTYPNAEKKIKSALLKRSFEVFLPLQSVTRQWRDRKKKLDVPLFPSYIFVNVSEKDRWNVLSTPGVVRFLTSAGQCSIISDREIDTIKRIMEGDFEVNVQPEFELGGKVRIVNGPLEGMEGILSEKKGVQRFLVRLENIEKVISLNVCINCLVKV